MIEKEVNTDRRILDKKPERKKGRKEKKEANSMIEKN